MYSNSSLDATARSIKLEDIEAGSSYNKYDWSFDFPEYGYTAYYGDVFEADSGSYYPKIATSEKTISISSKYGTLYGKSDQTSYVTGYGSASSLSSVWTTYSFKFSNYTTNMYYALFTAQTGSTGSTSHEKYWVSSRCSESYDGYFYLAMHMVSGGNLSYEYIGVSTKPNGSIGNDHALRPVVEIPMSSVSIGTTGSGTSSSPYSITAK